MTDINSYAVIVAGGRGTRMGGTIPKQFMPLMGLPVLCHSVQAFAHAIRNINIILVAPDDQIDCAQTILKSYLGHINVLTVAGGETRFHSVKNGLQHVNDDGIVFVHDGVRPLLSEELIYRCYEQAITMGSAVPVIPVTDSMRMLDEKNGSHPLDRSKMRIVQTPQTFLTEVILPAFKQPYNPSFTDEATVVEASGHMINLVDGDRENIKLTTPADMIIADTLLKASV